MILLITHSQDIYTIDIVQDTLRKKGMQSFRLDTDRFGTDFHFSFSPSGHIAHIVQLSTGITLAVDSIKAVWYRKLWHLDVPAELDGAFSNVFTQEYQTHLHILFHSLAHVPWMNPMDKASIVNANKLWQLSQAEATGLSIPKTIMTNSPEEVRRFRETCSGDIIMKLHGSLAKNMDGKNAFFPTTLLTREHLADMESLRYCPMIFQEEIIRSYELRVVYVDGEFFTGKITATDTVKPGTTDWRTASVSAAEWNSYALPDEIKTKIHVLMKSLGLIFGAIDLIRQPDGTYVFLEVNPQGEWGMLQRDLHYPIGETIAEKILIRINESA